MYGDKCFEKGKVTVMPNAIDTEKFAYDPEARVVLREELGIPEDAFVVGHVGRFTYAKNHGFLLKIFAELLKQKSNSYLLLVGDGELKAKMENRTQDLGVAEKVVFTGSRLDTNKLYSVMDVFCLPSFYEGMPVVAWEAQANGLACILSKNISQEADLSRSVICLDPQKPKSWVAALAGSLRKENLVCPVPDIIQAAQRLQHHYCAKEA